MFFATSTDINESYFKIRFVTARWAQKKIDNLNMILKRESLLYES